MDKDESTKNNSHESTDNKDNNPLMDTETTAQDDMSSDLADEHSGKEKKVKGDHKHDKEKSEFRLIEEKLAEMQDKYIRLSAEFDNYRKRTLREKMELSKYAGENLLLKIIPLMDDFERALKHMDTDTTDYEAMKNGIDLIYNKFSDFLKQNGVKEIESVNCEFNVDIHEAVAKVPVEESDKKGKVVDVLLKGYYLQDKVLRFSKVAVGE